MVFLDARNSLTDTIQGGLIDIGQKKVIKKSTQNSYQYSYQTTTNTSTDQTYSPQFTYQPIFQQGSTNATAYPTSTPYFVKKTITSATPSQVPEAILTSDQSSRPTQKTAPSSFMDNINNIATIGVIGGLAYLGIKMFKKRKK